MNLIATAFIHWDSERHKNSIETNLTHMNVLSEERNEVKKSLEKGIRWEMWCDSIAWTEQAMDGQVVYLCMIRYK